MAEHLIKQLFGDAPAIWNAAGQLVIQASPEWAHEDTAHPIFRAYNEKLPQGVYPKTPCLAGTVWYDLHVGASVELRGEPHPHDRDWWWEAKLLEPGRNPIKTPTGNSYLQEGIILVAESNLVLRHPPYTPPEPRPPMWGGP